MTAPHRVVLAVADPDLTGRASVLLEEAGDVEVLATVASTARVVDALIDTGAGAVVLDTELGPLPSLDLARDLNHRMPQVGVVLLAGKQDTELLHAAMGVGVRAVVAVPLMLADLHEAVTAASDWSATVQQRLEQAAADSREQLLGRVIGVAGSKGGVGTTTVAVQLALELQRRHPERSVCLVDLDLQTGDVRAYLDLTHRRSMADLVGVAAELTSAHLQDAMYTHPTGLRVLLPPVQGEDAEDVDGPTTTRIIGGIRARFDVVVIDLASVTNEATAAAIELTDDLLVVATPDVVSLRGTNRLVSLWGRLRVPVDAVRVLLNRVDRKNEITPQLAERVINVPLLDTTLPACFRDLEGATNTGVPDRLDGPVRTAVESLADELGRGARSNTQTVSEPPSDDLEQRVAAGELGAIAVEFVAMVGTIAFVLLLVWQFVLSGYTLILAQHAAREGAAAVAVDTPDAEVRDRVAEDMPGGWRARLEPDTDVVVGVDEVAVTLQVPLLAPGLGSPWRITTTAGTVRESGSRRGPP